MRIRPLTGQVLVEILPAEKRSNGGIDLPDHTLSPEEVQETHRNPQKPTGLQGIVVEVGPWPKLKNGMLLLPEFKKGARVVISPQAGIEMHWQTSGKLKMVEQRDVLAVLS